MCADGVPTAQIAQWLVRTYGLWDADLSLVTQVRRIQYGPALSLGACCVRWRHHHIAFTRELLPGRGEVSHGLLRVFTYMFILQLIEEDVRNNSAWNERHFVLTRGGQRAELPEPEVMVELRYTSERIHEDVDNAAAWGYLRALCVAGPALGGLPAVLPLATAVARDHPTNTNALELLADAAMQKVRRSGAGRSLLARGGLLLSYAVLWRSKNSPLHTATALQNCTFLNSRVAMGTSHQLPALTAPPFFSRPRSVQAPLHVALPRTTRRSSRCRSLLQLPAPGHRSLRCC